MSDIIFDKDYSALLTAVLLNTSTPDLEIEIFLNKSPLSDIGYIIIDKDDALKEESIFYHRKVGTSVFAYGINRTNPQQHEINANVYLTNSIDALNYLSDNTEQQMFIYKRSDKELYIRGGNFYVGGKAVTILDLDTLTGLVNQKLIVGVTNYLTIRSNAYYISSTVDVNYYPVAEIDVDALGIITDVRRDKAVSISDVVSAGGLVNSVNTKVGDVILNPDDLDDTATTNKFTTQAEIDKLTDIELLATADQTGLEIKTAYELELDTNAFTDAEKAKLLLQSGINTGDQDLTGLMVKANNLADLTDFIIARTNLNVDIAGTDNSTPVTKTDSLDIALTLVGQDIKADLIPTTVVAGSYTLTDITVDANGRITSITNGTGGAGDVVGPASSIDGGIVLFDLLTGKLLKDSAITIVTVLGSDDTTVPTSKAVADQIAAAGGGDMLAAVYDPSGLAIDVYDRANHTGTQVGTTVTFDNVASGLLATDIQGAVDEVEGRVDTLETNNTGTNTGDQTSIVGILGTLAEFNTSVTDAVLASLDGIETFTNKTLTSPVINAPTGLLSGDVGLGNVDNTSDATKNSDVATITNKSLVDVSTFIIDDLDNTKKLALSVGGITTLTTRTLIVQDKDGTIATTGDNISQFVNDSGYTTNIGDLVSTNNLSDLTDIIVARTNLNVDIAGTDNSTDVTVTDSANIDLTVTGQDVTADLIATGVVAGSYTATDITVDANGRITSASNGSGGGGTGLTLYDGTVEGEQILGDVFEIPLAGTATLSKFKISLSTLPVGADFIVTLYKNGVSEGTATIATTDTATNGLYVANLTVFTSGSYIEDDRITVSITQVGSTVAGNNLAYQIT